MTCGLENRTKGPAGTKPPRISPPKRAALLLAQKNRHSKEDGRPPWFRVSRPGRVLFRLGKIIMPLPVADVKWISAAGKRPLRRPSVPPPRRPGDHPAAAVPRSGGRAPGRRGSPGRCGCPGRSLLCPWPCALARFAARSLALLPAGVGVVLVLVAVQVVPVGFALPPPLPPCGRFPFGASKEINRTGFRRGPGAPPGAGPAAGRVIRRQRCRGSARWPWSWWSWLAVAVPAAGVGRVKSLWPMAG